MTPYHILLVKKETQKRERGGSRLRGALNTWKKSPGLVGCQVKILYRGRKRTHAG